MKHKESLKVADSDAIETRSFHIFILSQGTVIIAVCLSDNVILNLLCIHLNVYEV